MTQPPTIIDTWAILQRHRDEILRIVTQHGATNVRVFGSAIRGEATTDSDIDLLISVGEETSPWFPAGLAADLEDLLGRKWTSLPRGVSTGCLGGAF